MSYDIWDRMVLWLDAIKRIGVHKEHIFCRVMAISVALSLSLVALKFTSNVEPRGHLSF